MIKGINYFPKQEQVGKLGLWSGEEIARGVTQKSMKTLENLDGYLSSGMGAEGNETGCRKSEKQ